MEKRNLIARIQEYLAEELDQASKTGDDERVREAHQLILMYRFLPVREFGEQDVVCPAALVVLETHGTRAHYFLAPRGGGLITNVDGQAVQVITPQSPIGEAILGRRIGDEVEIPVRQGTRRYRVISIQ